MVAGKLMSLATPAEVSGKSLYPPGADGNSLHRESLWHGQTATQHNDLPRQHLFATNFWQCGTISPL
jgi:hypothetical protein